MAAYFMFFENTSEDPSSSNIFFLFTMANSMSYLDDVGFFLQADAMLSSRSGNFSSIWYPSRVYL